MFKVGIDRIPFTILFKKTGWMLGGYWPVANWNLSWEVNRGGGRQEMREVRVTAAAIMVKVNGWIRNRFWKQDQKDLLMEWL